MYKSFRTYYFGLTRIQKLLLKEKLISVLDINTGTFHNWLTRDTIPEKYKQKFALEVLDKPIEEVFPEFQPA